MNNALKIPNQQVRGKYINVLPFLPLFFYPSPDYLPFKKKKENLLLKTGFLYKEFFYDLRK